MSDTKAYFLLVVVIMVTMFTAGYFDRQANRLCVQEAIKANYPTKDIMKLCGGSYVHLGDKE